jgi:hypothetical protein
MNILFNVSLYRIDFQALTTGPRLLLLTKAKK